MISGVVPQTVASSRNGSRANWTRLIPVARTLSINSWGFLGWSDQVQTARRSRIARFMSRFLPSLRLRQQLDAPQSFHEIDEAVRLIGQPLERVRIRQFAGVIQEIVDAGKKDASGKKEGVAIAKDHLQLFHRTQG